MQEKKMWAKGFVSDKIDTNCDQHARTWGNSFSWALIKVSTRDQVYPKGYRDTDTGTASKHETQCGRTKT